MPSLKDLKVLVKNYSSDAPKLSSGKEALLLFAEKKGLLKKSDAPAPAPPADTVASLVKKEKVTEALPEVLKKKKAEKAKSEPKGKVAPLPVEHDEPKSKKASPFAMYMQSQRGQGKSMAQLSAEYREAKLQQ